ncbi:hypothetical protein BRM3_06395 [Brachybacterium huguangmaarense]|uniref:Pilus assembly protein CpaE n=1 Tax=Brachybacterium huguangmaarense TaxID=1652028 RepID=A0ABY6G5F6_9MICO|nr:hypothetical protein [Brachybacterium huguangmaarense]UYG18041.1 hypothetical protein BRM3_06395 [Brachybacterium huguangmaarense]
MIDLDVATRLRDRGLAWEPADGDWFVIDAELLRDQAFMLSSMVVERAVGRRGEPLLRFNGTTEWALDAIEPHEAIWIPREDQLREALGERFGSLVRDAEGHFTVSVLDGEGQVREIRAPHAEDAYAGALLVVLGS